MVRTIITTCGTSLFTSSAWDDAACIRRPALNAIENRTDRQLLEAENEDFTEQYRTAPLQLAKRFHRPCWEQTELIGKMPAELASLRSLAYYYEQVMEPQSPLSGEDRLIFYHSDNDEGRFCAKCLEAIFEDFDLLPGVQLRFEPLVGLEPQNYEKFGNALADLWKKGCDIIEDVPEGYRVILNLTGGYRAMGIVLSALGVFSASPVTMLYLHESTKPGDIHVCYFDRDEEFSRRLKSGFFSPTERRATKGFARAVK